MSFNIRARIAVVASIIAFPASAHHSHGNYAKEFVDIEGIVTEVALINPHAWIFVDVTDDSGQTTEWALEGTSRNALARLGVTPESISVGDRVKARCHPLTDGSEGCLLGFLQVGNTPVIDWDGSGAEPVDDGFFASD